MWKPDIVPNAGIRVKLFATIFGMFLLLFTGMLYIGMKNSQSALIEQKSQDLSVLVGRTGQYLDIYVQNISSTLYSIINSEGFFTGSQEQVEQIFRRHLNANPTVLSQLYYIKGNEVIASDALVYEIIGNPNLLQLYEQAMKNPELILWSKPYYSPLLAADTVAFSLVARDSSQIVQGLVIAEIDLSQLSGQLSTIFAEQEQTFLVLNEHGDMLSYDKKSSFIPFEKNIYPQRINAGFINALSGLSNGFQHLGGEFQGKLAARSNNNRLAWSIIALTDESVFQASVGRLQRQFGILGLISLLPLLVFTWIISRAFTRPIKLLALQMDRVRGDRLMVSVRSLERRDEIGQLARSYDSLMTRIQELMKQQLQTESRKKQMELKMLMSQIRPHFLYNTLNSIGNLARQNRNQDVEETIRSLIMLLTFSIDKKEDQVALGEELVTLEAYVQIQNIRYGNKIRFVVEVPEEDRRYLVPKLVLQPIVENAIFHGLARQAAGTLTVRSLAYDHTLSLFVIDDGEGLDVERVRALLDRAREQASPEVRQGLSSMGLANIQERIRLLHGEPYGLFFEPQPSSGAEIEVRLPLISVR